MAATKRTSSSKQASRTPSAATAAKQAGSEAQAARAEQATSTPSDTEARASAIVDPNAEIASSADAAEQRQAASGSGASAKAADEATPLAFAPGPVTNVAGIENLAVLESRERAKRIGDAANAAADPTAGERGKPSLRTVQHPALGIASGAERAGSLAGAAVEEHDEVVVPAPDGVHDIVFTRTSDGGVEISMQNAAAINSMRGGDYRTIVKMEEDAWNTVVDTLPGTQAPGEAPEAQSAAEQREGAGEGETGGPVAPHPIQL